MFDSADIAHTLQSVYAMTYRQIDNVHSLFYDATSRMAHELAKANKNISKCNYGGSVNFRTMYSRLLNLMLKAVTHRVEIVKQICLLNTYLLRTLAEPVTKWSLGKSKKIIFPCLKEEGRQHGRCLASLAAMEPEPWVRP